MSLFFSKRQTHREESSCFCFTNVFFWMTTMIQWFANLLYSWTFQNTHRFYVVSFQDTLKVNAILPGAVLDFNNANPDKAKKGLAGFGVWRKWRKWQHSFFFLSTDGKSMISYSYRLVSFSKASNINFGHHFEALKSPGGFSTQGDSKKWAKTAVTCLQPKSIFVDFIFSVMLTCTACTLQGVSWNQTSNYPCLYG